MAVVGAFVVLKFVFKKSPKDIFKKSGRAEPVVVSVVEEGGAE